MKWKSVVCNYDNMKEQSEIRSNIQKQAVVIATFNTKMNHYSQRLRKLIVALRTIESVHP